MRPPRYLFVCTANINRSPMGAAWVERYLTERFVAGEIRSAGTHAWEGAEAGAYTIDAMRELGFDLRQHRTTPLSAELVEWADHVVVMEPMHAEVVSKVAPDKVVRLWHWIDGAEEVDDPQGQPLEAHHRAAANIGEAVGKMVAEHLAARRARRG
jgi:protein-tyrosine-phosphatase